MDNTLKFGLSDSLINAVREVVEGKVCPTCGKSPCQCDGDVKKVEEALKGGQKKLDKNHNGKLDKQDFKILRKEEVEAIDEKSPYAHVNKAVSHTLKGKKADLGDNLKAASEHEPYGKHSPDSKVFRDRAAKVSTAIRKDNGPAVQRSVHKKLKNEEVESIDEVSLKTKINAYKAAKDPEADYSYGSKVHDQADRIHKNIVAKHGAKAGEHADRAAYGKPSTPASRSAEKAKPDVLKRDTTHPMRITKSGVAHKQDQKSNAAVIKSRLGKHGKSNIPEEVQFSEAEIARIEAILKDL